MFQPSYYYGLSHRPSSAVCSLCFLTDILECFYFAIFKMQLQLLPCYLELNTLPDYESATHRQL